MPFKANADRRHRIPKQRQKVTKWAEYDAGPRARGSLTVWFTVEAIKGWKVGGEPVHLLVDSTGLQLCGPGGWLDQKHGTKRRRAWKMLHLATDADTGQIVASVLTDRKADDGSQVGPLLGRIDGSVASFTGDGAYDRDDVHAEVAPVILMRQ